MYHKQRSQDRSNICDSYIPVLCYRKFLIDTGINDPLQNGSPGFLMVEHLNFISRQSINPIPVVFVHFHPSKRPACLMKSIMG